MAKQLVEARRSEEKVGALGLPLPLPMPMLTPLLK